MVGMKALSLMHPAPADAGEWALSRMRGRDGVALIVPDSFPAVVRIMHELTEDIGPEDGDYTPEPVRWCDALPEYVAHGPSTFWEEEVEPFNTMPGVLDRSIIAHLMPSLSAATATPQETFFGLWGGHGGLHSGSRSIGVSWPADEKPSAAEISAAREEFQTELDRRTAETTAVLERCPEIPWWGGRDAHLLQGPLNAIDCLGATDGFTDETDPLGPIWWWPQDRAWFIGNEIDDAWSYLAATQSLIDGVLRLSESGALEAYPVTFDSRW